jgi:hypothetical protein
MAPPGRRSALNKRLFTVDHRWQAVGPLSSDSGHSRAPTLMSGTGASQSSTHQWKLLTFAKVESETAGGSFPASRSAISLITASKDRMAVACVLAHLRQPAGWDGAAHISSCSSSQPPTVNWLRGAPERPQKESGSDATALPPKEPFSRRSSRPKKLELSFCACVEPPLPEQPNGRSFAINHALGGVPATIQNA